MFEAGSDADKSAVFPCVDATFRPAPTGYTHARLTDAAARGSAVLLSKEARALMKPLVYGHFFGNNILVSSQLPALRLFHL